MHFVLTMIIGIIVLALVIVIITLSDHIAEKTDNPSFVRTSNIVSVVMLTGLCIPMCYGVGDIALKLSNWMW